MNNKGHLLNPSTLTPRNEPHWVGLEGARYAAVGLWISPATGVMRWKVKYAPPHKPKREKVLCNYVSGKFEYKEAKVRARNWLRKNSLLKTDPLKEDPATGTNYQSLNPSWTREPQGSHD